MNRSRLSSIQYLRALATLTVVAAHSTASLFDFGEAAVSLFFVISGFVMLHVSQGRSSPVQFLWARFVRVVPLYWLVTIFVATAYGAGLDHLLMSLAFWPHPGPLGRGWPVIGQGWTLVFEVFFYAVFALTLLASVRSRPWIIATVFALLCALGAVLQPSNYALQTYTSPLLLEFAAGAMLHEIWRRRWLPSGFAAGCVLGGGVALLALQAAFGSPDHRWAAWGIVSVFLLAGAIGLEDAGRMPRMPLLQLVGDASYSLYLLQFFAINPVHKRLATWPVPVSTTIALIGSTILGLICYALLERPLHLMSSRLQALAVPLRRPSRSRPA
jgi:exopolysaccharide production protein ExoZ